MRCKVNCNNVEYSEDGAKLIMTPVVGDGATENDVFFKYTPAGQIMLTLLNLETAANFIPGNQYYVDFTEA